MLKILIFIVLSFNAAFSKDRFTDTEKQKFFDGLKPAISNLKQENKGKIDLLIIKPVVVEALKSFVNNKKISNEEMLLIKNRYENLIKDSINIPDKDQVLNDFIKNQFIDINQKTIEKKHEGMICNNSTCEDGLKCAIDPRQDDGATCKGMNRECKDDKDCCSSSCKFNKGSQKKLCGEVSKCFKPIALGQSCILNPVCASGVCSQYDANTLGIGECVSTGASCKDNGDCCSNSCSNNTCTESFICKDCVKNGAKVEKGRKCCEGLYPNEKGICIPDLPPIVIPQVKIKAIQNNILVSVGNIFISSAMADDYPRNGSNAPTIPANTTPMTASTPPVPEITQKAAASQMDFIITKKSNLGICNVYFKDDFFTSLKNEKILNLEVAKLSFDYVMLGQGVNDYWSSSKNEETSINGRLKEIAKENQQNRHATNKKFVEINNKLTCMCLDVKGYKEIKDQAKKTFFEKSCLEYAKYIDPKLKADQVAGDASGLKSKKLLVEWTKNLKDFNASLTVSNTSFYNKLAAVRDWTKSNAGVWSSGERKEDLLYHYQVKKLGLLAAIFTFLTGLGIGLFLYLNGAGATSSAFLLAVSLITSGYATIWVADSLKGAWQDKPPYIKDNIVQSHNCGFLDLYKCEEHDVVLNHAYNNICKIDAYANACIKNFMALYPNPDDIKGTPRYIIDPWVPAGVDKNLLIKDINQGKNYAESLEDSFIIGKGYVSNGSTEPEITTNDYAQFGLRFKTPKVFVLNKKTIDEIKSKAKQFAVDEKFFELSEEANLNIFANYSYEFHFLQPKLSKNSEISYPLVGLGPYLEFMSNGVAGRMATSAGNSAIALGKLNTQYLKDYLETLELYKDNPINQEEIKNTRLELDKQKALDAYTGNPNLDIRLEELNTNAIKSVVNSGATKTNSLSEDQKSFLGAIGKLRLARKMQLNKLKSYNAAIGLLGNSKRANSVATAAKSHSARLTGSSSTRSLNEVKNNSGNKSEDHLSSDSAKPVMDQSNANASKVNYDTQNVGQNSSSGNKENSTKNGLIDEDSRQVSEAIEARNKGRKDEYQSKDEQTLFEQVTNAYIRNYDKVLSKKKDKDIVEQK